MNRDDLIHGIRKVWSHSKAVGVDQIFSVPVPFEPSDDFKGISVNGDASYEEVYLAGLKEGQYNILLADYAFFQFGFGKVDGVRFAYYPNPFLGSSRDAVNELSERLEYVSEGLTEIEEFLHKVSEIRRSKHPPLLRYEYSPSQYVNLVHPSAHLHLGFHGDSRWPVRRNLTASAFGLLTLKLFYADFWHNAEPVKIGEDYKKLDQILIDSKIESRILPDSEFSNDEAAQFFWG